MIGFCGVKSGKDRLFLSKPYLHKKVRGKELSSILLKRAISFTREQDKKATYLIYNKFNQHSLDVHHVKGFKDIDSAQTDIGQGFITDDYILQLELDDGKQEITLFTVMMLRKEGGTTSIAAGQCLFSIFLTLDVHPAQPFVMVM